MEQFLISVEKRAYRMALVSLGHHEDALDVVQDAMMQLVRRYSDKPEDEWRPLFYRILQNRINDLHRKNRVRNRFKGWLPTFGSNGDSDENSHDPIQDVPAPEHYSPEASNEQRQALQALEAAVSSLPTRQQQAFMLRCWEGLSTRETAEAMKCSEGSVKTHYSRAMSALRNTLERNIENEP